MLADAMSRTRRPEALPDAWYADPVGQRVLPLKLCHSEHREKATQAILLPEGQPNHQQQHAGDHRRDKQRAEATQSTGEEQEHWLYVAWRQRIQTDTRRYHVPSRCQRDVNCKDSCRTRPDGPVILSSS